MLYIGVLGCPFCRKVNVIYWCVRVSILQESECYVLVCEGVHFAGK